MLGDKKANPVYSFPWYSLAGNESRGGGGGGERHTDSTGPPFIRSPRVIHRARARARLGRSIGICGLYGARMDNKALSPASQWRAGHASSGYQAEEKNPPRSKARASARERGGVRGEIASARGPRRRARHSLARCNNGSGNLVANARARARTHCAPRAHANAKAGALARLRQLTQMHVYPTSSPIT